MANDPFLTKKSVAGLAERVLLTPPTLIEFQLYETQNSSSGVGWRYNDLFYDWYAEAPIGAIAIGYCTLGGNYLLLYDTFVCILQKSDLSGMVYGFGLTISDDSSELSNIKLLFDMDNELVNNLR